MPVLYRIKHLENRGRNKEKEALAYRFSMMLARGLFYLTGSTVELLGLEKLPDGPVLFVSNHQSHLDSAVIHGFIPRPKGFVADKDAENIPILRTWMKYMKCIFIDRKNVMQNINSMENGIRLLKEGHSLVIYPEGRINASNQLANFKKGGLKMAIKAGVPVVPVILKDTHLIMNRSGFGIRKAHIKCIISDPICVQPQNGRNSKNNKHAAAQMKKVREIIANNLL
jgi:1-acyl-sn-glycerol-3-phosphate acyltransferase